MLLYLNTVVIPLMTDSHILIYKYQEPSLPYWIIMGLLFKLKPLIVCKASEAVSIAKIKTNIINYDIGIIMNDALSVTKRNVIYSYFKNRLKASIFIINTKFAA